MKKMILGVCALTVLAGSLSGCTGSIKASQPGCTYSYALVPALSVSRWLNQCGPVAHSSAHHESFGAVRH